MPSLSMSEYSNCMLSVRCVICFNILNNTHVCVFNVVMYIHVFDF